MVAFVARGGQYDEQHSQTAFLRQILSFLSMDDARFFLAEGLALGDESREASLAAVRHEIAKAAIPLAEVT